jgi:ferric-dicitrate binding protein FerR (iron transport regulator)
MKDQDLIDKFYRGECTPEEARKVRRWFDNQQRGEEKIEHLWQDYTHSTAVGEDDATRNLRQIHAAIKPEQREGRFEIFRSQWLRVAAIITFALVVSYLLAPQLAVQPPVVAVQQIIKENPFGQKSTHRLPDGTMVRLNAGSRITYPERFAEDMRQVHLQGEAFFEVTENADKPFIVGVNGLDVRVLGTSFNVRAFDEDEELQVVLATGKVKVTHQRDETEAYLVPGEEVVYEKESGEMRKQLANLDAVLAWKNDQIVFDDASAYEVFDVLERWYGVQINYEALPENAWDFTGRFEDENLENVLTSISYVKKFSFTLNDKIILITP